MRVRPSGPRMSELPYNVLAGVEPVSKGWLVAPGNLQGINLAPQPVMVLPTLADLLDYRPAFTVVALHAPVGTVAGPGEFRSCDTEARRRLGRSRNAVVPAPSRALLGATTFAEASSIDPTVDAVRWSTMAKANESIREVQSWRQRLVWEVNPELAVTTMNGGAPLPIGRRSPEGRDLRRKLVTGSLPGADRILDQRPPGIKPDKLVDALADLWLARRIVARAITRMADPPVWDDEGVRMDIVC